MSISDYNLPAFSVKYLPGWPSLIERHKWWFNKKKKTQIVGRHLCLLAELRVRRGLLKKIKKIKVNLVIYYLIPCPGPQLIWWTWTLEQPVCMDTQSSPVKRDNRIRNYNVRSIPYYLILNPQIDLQKQKWVVSVFFVQKLV
jgi:hypothetical protein